MYHMCSRDLFDFRWRYLFSCFNSVYQGELLSRDKFVHLVQCATLCKEYDLSRGCRPNYNYLKKYKKIINLPVVDIFLLHPFIV